MIMEFYISFYPNLEATCKGRTPPEVGRRAEISEAMRAIEFDHPDTSDPRTKELQQRQIRLVLDQGDLIIILEFRKHAALRRIRETIFHISCLVVSHKKGPRNPACETLFHDIWLMRWRAPDAQQGIEMSLRVQ